MQVLTLEVWHLVVLLAVIVLGGIGYYVAGREKRAEAARAHAAAREARRSDEVARLTPPSAETIGPNAATMSNERLRARAHDLAGQLKLLATQWVEAENLHDQSHSSAETGAPERRGAERLRDERRAHARTLYGRIRHDVLDVRTALLSRVESGATSSRDAGIDRTYEHPSGADPFRSIADDLELLASSLRER